MKKLILWISEVRGWRAALLLFVAGFCAALSLPPIGQWWLLLLTFPVIVLRIENTRSLRSSILEGWFFGFGYFCNALHWIGFAFLIDAATYLWMMPFAVGGLAAAMAGYWGIASAAAFVLRKLGWQVASIFPVCLALAEWLRGHLLTGFPWAAPGLAADGMGGFVQLASVIGMPGLTLLLILLSTTWLQLLRPALNREKYFAASIVALCLFGWLWGSWRVEQTPVNFVAGVGLRIVQPNISQDDKWRSDNTSKIFDELIADSFLDDGSNIPITHIIWPESAVPFLLAESKGARAILKANLDGTKILITGAIRRSAPDPDAQYFTSILVIGATDQVLATYDKWRLVPGGEYLPFAWLLEPLGFKKLVTLPGAFTAGSGPKTVEVPGAGKTGLIICYEVIFPNLLVEPDNRPNWIVNVTNDGWFGNSTGPYQHLAQARLRAIEQGLPIVRAANSGISAIIDPIGRVHQATKLTERAILSSRLPSPLPPPPYSLFGDMVIFLLCAFVTTLTVQFTWKLRRFFAT